MLIGDMPLPIEWMKDGTMLLGIIGCMGQSGDTIV